ncbi:MAG: hypothetical protein HY744_06810 [Deltaproteobacteria bacterium]|nr:hypothetical protein [Deltaproteobacteria bacterium]
MMAVGKSPYLYQDFQLAVLTKAAVEQNVFADSVFVANKGSIGADVATDHLTAEPGSVIGGAVSPYAGLSMPAFPPVAPVAPGVAAVTVAKKTLVLEAGAYGAVDVQQGATLRLAGLYQVASLNLGESARLEATAPLELRVANRVQSAAKVFIGPAPGSNLTAKGIRLEVSGVNGGNGDVMSGPKAANFGTWCELHAIIVVPSGTLVVGPYATVKGALFARDVDIEQHTKIST